MHTMNNLWGVPDYLISTLKRLEHEGKHEEKEELLEEIIGMIK